MWDTIINPSTGRSVKITGVLGKKILNNYVNMLNNNIGGDPSSKKTCSRLKKYKSPKCSDNTDCKWVSKQGCVTKIKDQGCKSLKKTKPPKCTDNTHCEWITKKGCVQKSSTSDISNKTNINSINKIITKKPSTALLPYNRPDSYTVFSNISEYNILKQRGEIRLNSYFLETMAHILASSAKREIGGLIDIDRSRAVERSLFKYGQQASIGVEDLMDFEIMYHTHPFRRRYAVELPSGADIEIALRRAVNINRTWGKKNVIVDLIFAPDAIYTLYTNIDYTNINYGGSLYNTIISEVRQTNRSPFYGLTLASFKKLQTVCSKHGIYIQRHTRNLQIYNNTNTDNNASNIIKRWPKELSLYLTPSEPLRAQKLYFNAT